MEKTYSSKIEFEDPESIKFPKNCVYCGKRTDRYFEKKFFGKFKPQKEYKSNYEIKIPFCSVCQDKADIKEGFQNSRLWITIFSFIFGIISMIILMLNTYAIIFGITIISLSFIIPFYFYRQNVKNIINLDEMFKIKFDSNNKDLISILMDNDNYIRFLDKINNKNQDNELEKSN